MKSSSYQDQPNYQTVISWATKFIAAFLIITNAIVNISDSINYPLSVISPKIALISTILVVAIWTLSKLLLKRKGILWKVDGKIIRIRGLGSHYRRYALALVLMLWIGPVFNWVNSIPSFKPAKNNEILVVIAKFQLGENVPDLRAYEKIKLSIEELRDELNLNNLRVEIDTKANLNANDYLKALSLGEKYKAMIVIWGTETRVDLQVNFYNIKAFRTSAAKSSINKLIFPDEYSTLVVQYIPDRINFLSLLSLADVLSYQGNHDQALNLINEAIESVQDKPVIDQERSVAEAYFRLGLILADKNEYQDSIDAYSKAIELFPATRTYNNRGLAKLKLKIQWR